MDEPLVLVGDGVPLVHRPNAVPAGIAELRPSHLVISPGPKTPDEAGISVACEVDPEFVVLWQPLDLTMVFKNLLERRACKSLLVQVVCLSHPAHNKACKNLPALAVCRCHQVLHR